MAFARGAKAATPKQRFSLLLLEPGEIYFDDASVVYYPDPVELNDADASLRRSAAAGDHAQHCRR